MSDDITDDERGNDTATDEQDDIATDEQGDGAQSERKAESGRTVDFGRANTSRRKVLHGVAAGSLAGIGGFGAVQAQDTTTEDGQETTAADGQTTTAGDGRQGFFEAGTEVGVRMVADGPLTAPTDFAVAEGDDRRFVADQTGEVYVVTDDGLRDEPFLDVSDRMVELGEFQGQYADPNSDYEERGLLGIEMHPEFSENRRFFVHYSAPPNDETPDDWSHVEVLSEFRASDDGESGDPDSERRLLEIQSPQYNHDSGPMAFGPDGYLYFPMGDGGGANDEMLGHVDDWYGDNAGGNGQNTTENLLGGIHRIDVDAGTAATTADGAGETTAAGAGETTAAEGGETTVAGAGETTAAEAGETTAAGGESDRPYGIPDDNPFADGDGGLPEYYAWGFRNPFGISFDSDGRLFVADAGQDVFEEANVVERGGNYGWNVKEGTHCFSTDNPAQHPAECPTRTPDDVRGGEELIDPIVEYPHVYRGEFEGIVIVGGHFYEQDAVPGLQGKYVFGDWTKDPQREEPAGRILAATDPGDGAGTTADGAETTPGAETADGDVETTPGAETTPGGETTADGDTRTVPRDQLWEMEELVVAGSEDGTLDWFVRMFGRDGDGEIYVLVNRRGVPEGDTGAVLQIVPPGEGDGSATADETTVEGEGQETVAGEGQETVAGEGETATDAGEDETTVADGEETTVEAGDETTVEDSEETTTVEEDE